jgi:hypothetical protein
MALSMDLSKLSNAVSNKWGWWAWAIVGAGGGSDGGGLLPGGGWVVDVCRWYICTTGGFSPDLLGAKGPLDIGGVWVCMGLESPDEVVWGGGSGMGCFPLDTGGIGTCFASREGCLEIWGSELSCNWGVLGKLASLSAVEVIACSTDRSNSSTLAVLSSDPLWLSLLSGASRFSVSEVLEPLKCYFYFTVSLCWGVALALMFVAAQRATLPPSLFRSCGLVRLIFAAVGRTFSLSLNPSTAGM